MIDSPETFQLLQSHQELFRHSVSIVEPWENAGINLEGGAVRASKNVAYILQQTADADSILYPVWQSGVKNPEQMASVLSAGIATVAQGGNPSAHDPSSFDGSADTMDDL